MSQREILKHLETNENESTPKLLEFTKSYSKKEVHSHTCLPQGEKKNPDKQPNLTPKGK